MKLSPAGDVDTGLEHPHLWRPALHKQRLYINQSADGHHQMAITNLCGDIRAKQTPEGNTISPAVLAKKPHTQKPCQRHAHAKGMHAVWCLRSAELWHLEEAVCPPAIAHDWRVLLSHLTDEGRELVPVISCETKGELLGSRKTCTLLFACA